MDDETAKVVGELREIAASLGLTMHPVSADEFREVGRRGWLRLGYRYHITLSTVDSAPESGWSVDEAAALARFAALADEHGGSPGVVITLIDEVERRMMAVHPGWLS